MKRECKSWVRALCCAGALAGLLAVPAHASLWEVTMNTASQNGTLAVMFFDLVDGDGATNNTANIVNFGTDGTLGAGSGDPAGAVTGSLPGTVVMNQVDPPPPILVSLSQDITLGDTVSFRLDLTENFAPGGILPDSFAFSIFGFDANGGLIDIFDLTDPTICSALWVLDLDGSGAQQTCSPLITVRQLQTPVPAPAPLWLVLLGLPLLGIRRSADRPAA